MRKNVNKLATLVMTGMLAASMSFGAFAAEDTMKIDDGNNSITITKNVPTDINNQTKAPYTEFDLTVAGVSEEKVNIKTKDGNKTLTITKPTDTQINSLQDSLTKANFMAEYKKAEDGTDNNGYSYNAETGVYTSKFKLSIDLTKYEAPGLYAFTLTEINDRYTGVTYDTTPKVMYVSIVNKFKEDGKTVDLDSTNKPILVVDSVVLADYAKNEDGTLIATAKIKDITNDFGADNTNGGKTHDLTIEKTVTGNAGDQTKKFEFKVSVKPAGHADVVAPEEQEFTLIELNNNGPDGKPKTHTISAKDSDTTVELKAGEKVKIEGLTGDYDVYVKESEAGKNGYTTKYTKNEGVTVTDTSAKVGDELTDSSVIIVEAIADSASLTVTNDRVNVTPTGVAMDIAPYALMVALAGGAAATFLRKKESFED